MNPTTHQLVNPAGTGPAGPSPAGLDVCPSWMPVCPAIDGIGDVIDGAGDVVDTVTDPGGAVLDAISAGLDLIAKAWWEAGTAVLNWVWGALDSSTSVDLTSDAVRNPLIFTSVLGLIIAVGLCMVQVMASVLRQDPGGLARAVRGLGIASIGAPFAVAATTVLLAAVDQASTWVVQTTGEKTMAGLGGRLVGTAAVPVIGPILLMLAGLVMIFAAVIVWISLMVRGVLIVVAAVFSAWAFAGGASDGTMSWVRKWIEIMFALVISKLVLVIVMAIGFFMFTGDALGGEDGIANLGAGLLVLCVAGLSPFAAIKLVNFAGDGFHTMHAGGQGLAAGGRAVTSAPGKALNTALRGQGAAGVAKSLSNRGNKGPTSDAGGESTETGATQKNSPTPTKTQPTGKPGGHPGGKSSGNPGGAAGTAPAAAAGGGGGAAAAHAAKKAAARSGPAAASATPAAAGQQPGQQPGQLGAPSGPGQPGSGAAPAAGRGRPGGSAQSQGGGASGRGAAGPPPVPPRSGGAPRKR